jgi:hypothetical protein
MIHKYWWKIFKKTWNNKYLEISILRAYLRYDLKQDLVLRSNSDNAKQQEQGTYTIFDFNYCLSLNDRLSYRKTINFEIRELEK